MQVTNVRVSFLREKQPAQYEKSAPAVEYAATLSDGENHEAAARSLMISATKVVYNGLGYAVPPKVAAALAEGVVPAELSVSSETTDASPEAPEAAEEAKDKPKTRGRPKGAKNTAPKKETAAAKRKREAAEQVADEQAAGSVGMDDEAIPGDDEPTPNISSGDEDRVDPNDDDAVPGEDEIPEEIAAATDGDEFTPIDLNDFFVKMIGEKKLSTANAKQVLAHFKVARVRDLTNEQALEGKGMVEKMMSA